MRTIELQSHDASPEHTPADSSGMGVGGAVFGLAMGILSIYCGVKTWKKGHKLLFWVGLFVPVLWFVGALMKPAAPQHTRLA